MGGPKLAQHLDRALRQRHITIFAPLAVPHVKHHARAVDICHLKARPLLQPQPARVDGRQAYSVARQSDAIENLSHLFGTEDHWELFLTRRSNQAQCSELSVECLLEEELDAAQRDGAPAARPLLDILDVEEILSQ